MADSRFLIYGLTDPRNGQVRYIGKSSGGLDRPKNHGQPKYLKVDHTYKANWIRSLLASGLQYGIVVLEELPSRDGLDVRERWWIAFARAWGLRLTNLTDGGEGMGGWEMPQSVKKKRSEQLKALWQVPSYREAFLSNHLGKKRTQETRDRIAAKAKNRVVSEETRAKLSMAGKLRYLDPLERAKTADHSRGRRPMLGHVHSPGSRAKMSESRRGHFTSEETREKLSSSIRAYHVARSWGCAL